MRVLILDNNELFAVGLKHFLEAARPAMKVECASCSGQAEIRLSSGPFALLLLEIRSLEGDSIRVLERLRTKRPRVPILVLTDGPSEYYGPRAIRAGAFGFLQKNTQPQQLLAAIHCVLEGRRYMEPDLVERFVGEMVGGAEEAPHEVLSTREFQVFRKLAIGETPTQIARGLSLSVKTIDTHRSRVFQKLGFKTREELTRYAFERGLIPSRRLSERGQPSIQGAQPSVEGQRGSSSHDLCISRFPIWTE